MARTKAVVVQEEEENLVENQETIAEEDSFFQSIDELQNQGIGVADINKLKAVGICTIRAIQMTARRNLIKIKGLSETKVDKICEAANKILDCGFITATECAFKRQSIFRLETGCKEFDAILGGGFQSMAITEVFGEFRTGKTQIAHTLCVKAQMPVSMGGCAGKAAYIDTEGTFRPERLRAIAERYDMEPEEVCENVIYARAYNSDHQMELINLLAAKFAEENGVYRLLVVDSIISLFRTDYGGRGELSERQQKLNTMMSRLLKMSEEFNLIVYITNQMTADPGAGMTFVADPKKPVGGHIIAHASTVRISLRKGRGDTRVAKIYDAPDVPEAEAVYSIGQGGITEPVE